MKNKDLTSFFPYEQKTKKAYFVYLGLATVLSLFVFIFSLFATINVARYQLYNLPLIKINYPILNLLYTPILCLITVIISMILLLLAPKVSKIALKNSNRMFFLAFWLLIFSVMLSSAVQTTYISNLVIVKNSNYHWINPIVAKLFIIIVLFLVLLLPLFFWIMHQKFTFMPSNHDFYTNKSITKKSHKIAKQILKK